MGLFFCMGSRKSTPVKPLFVIFLDIKGVLYYPKTQQEREFSARQCVDHCDIQSIENIEVLVATIEANHNVKVGIVLTSPICYRKGLTEIKELFHQHPIHKYFIGKTQDYQNERELKQKGLKIFDWLQFQKGVSGEEYISGYLVLNEQNHDISKFHSTQFIHCSSERLFDKEKLGTAITMVSMQFEKDDSTYSEESSNRSILDGSDGSDGYSSEEETPTSMFCCGI